MTRASETSDEEILARLRIMYQTAVEQAGHDAIAVPISRPAHHRIASLAGLGVIALLAVVGLSLGIPLIGGTLTSERGGVMSPSAVSQPSHPAPTTSPTASPVLRNGIPVTINDEEVLTGQAAVSALQDSTDDHTIFIGGWLRGGDQTMSCPLNPGPWNPCRAIQVYADHVGGVALFVYRATASPIIGRPSSGQAQAIVMRVHTHDSRCVMPGTDCSLLPVLDQVVWLGTSGPAASLGVGVTAPPGGVSRSRAILTAEAYLASQGPGSATLRTATLGRYGTVGGGGAAAEGTRWVWALVFYGSFLPAECASPGGVSPAPCAPAVTTELIVIDYLDGTFLKAEAPAPAGMP